MFLFLTFSQSGGADGKVTTHSGLAWVYCTVCEAHEDTIASPNEPRVYVLSQGNARNMKKHTTGSSHGRPRKNISMLSPARTGSGLSSSGGSSRGSSRSGSPLDLSEVASELNFSSDIVRAPAPAASAPAAPCKVCSSALAGRYFSKNTADLSLEVVLPIVFVEKLKILARTGKLVDECDIPCLQKLTAKEAQDCRFVLLTRCWAGKHSLYKDKRFIPDEKDRIEPRIQVLHDPLRCESVDFGNYKCFCRSHLRWGTGAENNGENGACSDTELVRAIFGSNFNSNLYRVPTISLYEVWKLFRPEEDTNEEGQSTE